MTLRCSTIPPADGPAKSGTHSLVDAMIKQAQFIDEKVRHRLDLKFDRLTFSLKF